MKNLMLRLKLSAVVVVAFVQFFFCVASHGQVKATPAEKNRYSFAFAGKNAVGRSPESAAKAETRNAPLDALKQWAHGAEIKELRDNPALLGKLVEKKNLADFDGVPAWISQALVGDAKKTELLRQRLAMLARTVPAAAEVQPVFFTNPMPFFALGNKSFLFISTTSVDEFNENEFAAAGFHELAHLIFADVYWDLRRQGNAEAVRQIELNCDLFSLMMLKKANVPTKNLEQLLKKVDKMEGKGTRDAAEAAFYPSVAERVANIKNFQD
jgi:hypothetical protein